MSRITFSPYIAFCEAKRDEVKAANTTAAFGDTARILSTLWKEMSESEKAVYADPRLLRQRDPESTGDGLRRSNRLRNKARGVNFFGVKSNE